MTHLVPMTRGILSSCYARLKPGAFSSWEDAKTEIRQLYMDFYARRAFREGSLFTTPDEADAGEQYVLAIPHRGCKDGSVDRNQLLG